MRLGLTCFPPSEFGSCLMSGSVLISTSCFTSCLMSMDLLEGVNTVDVDIELAEEVMAEDMVLGVFPVVLGAIKTSFKVWEFLPSSCFISVFICVLPAELVTVVIDLK